MSDLPQRPTGPRTPTVARHRRRAPAIFEPGVAKAFGLVASVAVVSSLAITAIAGWHVQRGLTVVPLASEASEAPAPNIASIDGGVNLLLVGSDSREGQNGIGGDETSNLNDVTMLVHIAQDRSTASVVSFPRDLTVSIPECTDDRGRTTAPMTEQPLNVTLLAGGLPCTVSTVENLTGLSIPFAAEIQFTGVVELSDALGGVPVCVSTPIDDDYTGIHLAPGTHQLQGLAALEFLRTRHGVGDGSDLGRISSQQVFLSSLVRAVKSTDVLADPAKVYGLAKVASDNMTVSRSLSSPDAMVSIALALGDVPLENIGFYLYPGTTGSSGADAANVKPLEKDAAVLFAALRDDRPLAVAEGGTGIGAEVDPNSLPATVASVSAVDGGRADIAESARRAASGKTVLPSSITGQSAADYTCARGPE